MNQNEILQHIEHYASTGIISDALIPYFDQDGIWRGDTILWKFPKLPPAMKRIKSFCLPASRRTEKDRTGTLLRTTFYWRGHERVCLTYSGIHGSLIVKGNAVIQAAGLRHVGGHLISTTDQRVDLPNLRTVGRHFELMSSFHVNAPRLRHVGGNVLTLGYAPPMLETVGGRLGAYWAFDFDLTCLKHVGGFLILSKAEKARFPVLETVGASILSLLTKSIEAPKLQSIGRDFLASTAIRIRTPMLRSVGGNMETQSAKGYYHPSIRVGGVWTTYPNAIQDWELRESVRRVLKGEPFWL